MVRYGAMENHEPPKEGIVLDAEGKTIHDPKAGRPKHIRVDWSVPWTPGLFPKILMGAGFLALVFTGFAVAAVVLLFVALGWLLRGGKRLFK